MLQREDGFTLIEFIVAGVYLSIVVLAIYGTFNGISQINKQTNDDTTAVAAAQEIIEEYRNMPYANIATGTTNMTSSILANDNNLESPRSASVTVTLVNANGIKEVDATVGWTSLTGYKTVELSTQISYIGINK
jgi:Tfp pilus assembly protein PilE